MLRAERRRHLEALIKINNELDQMQPPKGRLPDFARVLIAQNDMAPEVIGKEGVVVGSARSSDGEWMYNVLIQSLEEAFYLPHAALEFSGEIAPKTSIYRPTSIRVRTDAAGRGTIVKSTSRNGRGARG